MKISKWVIPVGVKATANTNYVYSKLDVIFPPPQSLRLLKSSVLWLIGYTVLYCLTLYMNLGLTCSTDHDLVVNETSSLFILQEMCQALFS